MVFNGKNQGGISRDGAGLQRKTEISFATSLKRYTAFHATSADILGAKLGISTRRSDFPAYAVIVGSVGSILQFIGARKRSSSPRITRTRATEAIKKAKFTTPTLERSPLRTNSRNETSCDTNDFSKTKFCFIIAQFFPKITNDCWRQKKNLQISLISVRNPQ